MKQVINRIERGDVTVFKAMVEGEQNIATSFSNSIDAYANIAVQSAVYPGQGTPFGLMYTALGLAEAGEVQNKVKKLFRDDAAIEFVDQRDRETVVRFNPITDERRAQLIKELGGVMWYIAATCRELGIQMSDVALANLEELCGRGERGTLSGSGDDR